MDEMNVARQVAHEIWQAWHAQVGDDSPTAVSVRAIVEGHNVTIANLTPAEYPHTLGYLDPDDDLIWLRPGLAPTVERFTLAHELGHWRLNHRGASGAHDDQCAATDIAHSFETTDHTAVLRPEESYSPHSQRERQANAFAAELLAPLTVVRALYLGTDGRAPRSAEQIATVCQVSKAVIIMQLARLLARDSVGDAPEAAATEQQADRVPRLDASQRAAVTAPSPALIVAGPGTGKTSTLVARVRWLVENGTQPEQILAMTFSRKAAQVMRDRIAAALGAALGDPTPAVTTFHRFGADLLRRYGHLVGLRPDFRLVDQIGGFFVLRDIARELPLNYFASLVAPTQHFGDLLNAISKAKDELVDPARYAALAAKMLREASPDNQDEVEAAGRAAEVAAVYAVYQQELARRGDADYGDLIMLAVRLLVEQPEVAAELRDQYPQVLVDEFQDINRANGILLKHLAGPSGNIWAVGDANQAIYRFRGASPANIANFRADYPGAEIVPLRQNYRSRPAIVDAANRFAAATLQHEATATLVAIAPTRDAAPEMVQLRVAPDSPSEIAAIVADLAQRHAAGAQWGEHAILCRTRSLAGLVTAALRQAAIPVETRTDLFENEAVKDVLGVPQLLAGETGGLLRAANVADHHFTRTTALAVLATMRDKNLTLPLALDDLVAQPGLNAPDRAGLAHLKNALGAIRYTASVSQALAMYLFDLTTCARHHLQLGNGDTAAHLAELLAYAARFDQERPIVPDGDPDVTATRRWREFVTFLRTIRTLQRDAAQWEEAGSEVPDCVRVQTVHAAKGLEWPVVYLPRLATTYFPVVAKHDPIPPPPGLVAGDQADPKLAHRTEEACLFYVALTRARDTVVLSRAEKYGKVNRKASDFLVAVLRDSTVEPVRVPSVGLALPEDDDADPSLPVGDDPPFTWPDALPGGALTTYDACPRQFAYRYGYRFAGRRGNWMRLRQAVSAALRDATHHASDAAHALHVFDETWQATATPDGDEEADPFADLFARHGRAAVETTFDQLHKEGAAITADATFARVVHVTVQNALVRVELDRIEGESSPTEPMRAVRHHVGRRNKERPADIALYLAMLAQRQVGGDELADTVYEHHLNSGEMLAAQIKTKEEARLREKVELAVKGIYAASFPALPDARRCAGCEFALICPA